MDKFTLRMAVMTAGALAAVPGMAAAGGIEELGEEPAPFQGADPSEMFGSFVWLMVALAIVITLIILLIKWLSKRSRAWGVNRSMRSLGGVALGQNSSLQVVEIAGRIYVVGVGESITLIDKLDDPQQVADVIAALDKDSSTGAWAPAELATLVGKWRNRKNESGRGQDETNDASSAFQQMLQSKLNDQTGRKQQLEELLQHKKRNERLMDDET